MYYETRTRYLTIHIDLINNKSFNNKSIGYVFDQLERKILYITEDRTYHPLPLTILLIKKKDENKTDVLWDYFDDNFDNNATRCFENNITLTTDIMSGLVIRRKYVQGSNSWE